jgi:hypothetical protein
MAVKGNLVIDQGTDYKVTLNVENLNSMAANLVGYTAAAKMKKYYTSSKSYIFGATIDPADGTVELTMDANTTHKITAGRYVYDCEVRSPGGTITRLIEGIVTVTPQVTK